MAYATFSNITTGTQDSNATSTVVPIEFPLYGGESLLLFITKDGTGMFIVPSGWTSLYNEAYSGQCFGVFMYREEDPTSALSSVTITHEARSTSWILCRIPNLLRAVLTSATGSSNQPNPPLLQHPYRSTTEMTYIAAAGWDYNRTVSSFPSDCPDNRTSAISTISVGTGTAIATKNVVGTYTNPSYYTISSTDTWNAVTVGLVIGAVPVKVQKKTVSASSITFSAAELASRSGDLVLVAIQSMNSSKIYAPSTDWVLFSTAESGYTVTSHFYIRSNGSLPESTFIATGSPEMSAIWYRMYGAFLARSRVEKIIRGTTSVAPYSINDTFPSNTTITCISVASSEPSVSTITHPANMTDTAYYCFAETQSTSNGAIAVTGAFDVSNSFAPGNYTYSSAVDFCGIAALFYLENDPTYVYGDICGYSDYAYGTTSKSTTAPCPSTADPDGKFLLLISFYYSNTNSTSFTLPAGWTMLSNKKGSYAGQRFVVAWKDSAGLDASVSFTHDLAMVNVMVLALVGISAISSIAYRSEYNNYVHPAYFLQTASPFANKAAIHLAWRIWASSATATDLTNFTDNVHLKTQTDNRMHICTRDGLALLTADATSGMQTTLSSSAYTIMTSICLECASSYNRTITVPQASGTASFPTPLIGSPGTYSGGSGTSIDPYILSNTGDLVFLSNNPFERGACFVLSNDIDMNAISFVGIGDAVAPFSGQIDGAGYSIKNLSITSSSNNCGFINYADSNVYTHILKNITFINANIYSTGENVGIIGYAKNIEGILAESVYGHNCVVEGSVCVGGISGIIIDVVFNTHVSHIKKCGYYGTVRFSSYNCGGIVGSITTKYGTITECVADVTLVNTAASTPYNIGGIGGYVKDLLEVSNCIAKTEVDFGPTNYASEIGGAFGNIAGTSNTDYTNAKNIVAKLKAYQHKTYNIGGIAGYAKSTAFDSCAAICDIYANYWIGGIVGFSIHYSGISREIKNCISFGNITPSGTYASPTAGGICSENYYWPIVNCVSFCSISTANYSDMTYVAGVLGDSYDMVGNVCTSVHYSTTNSPGVLNVVDAGFPYTGSGETNTDLTYPAKAGLYDGWDFSTKWYWTSLAGSYPRLYGATFVEGETANSSSLLQAPQIITAINAFVASATQEASADVIAPSLKGNANISGLQFAATSSAPAHSLLATSKVVSVLQEAIAYGSVSVAKASSAIQAVQFISNASFQVPLFNVHYQASVPISTANAAMQIPFVYSVYLANPSVAQAMSSFNSRDSDLTDYPVMVKLTSGNFDFSKTRSDGFDITFWDGLTQLDHEIEYFNPTEQMGVFHVRIPLVSSMADTTFTVRYGNPSATDTSNKTGVWDGNFVMVQHMGDSLVDSTGNGNDGTNYGTTVVGGLNGRARSFDGVNDYISFLSEIKDGDNLTVQALVNPIVGDYGGIVTSCSSGSVNDGYALELRSTGEIFWNANSSSVPTFLETNSALSNFALATGRYDGVKQKLDVQLLEESLSNNATGALIDGINTTIGVYGRKYYYNGIIDEVRISNIARSDAWIKADDYNLRTNSLINIGIEQELAQEFMRVITINSAYVIFSGTASTSASTSIANGSFQLPSYYGNGYAQPPAMNSTGVIQSPDLLVMSIVVKAAPACSAGSYVNTPSFYKTANIGSAVLISNASIGVPSVALSKIISVDAFESISDLLLFQISAGATIVDIQLRSDASTNIPDIAIGNTYIVDTIEGTAGFLVPDLKYPKYAYSPTAQAIAQCEEPTLIRSSSIVSEQILAYADTMSHSLNIGATIVSISPDSSATLNVPLIALGRIMEAEGIISTAYFQEVEYLLDNNVFSDLFVANASAQARVLVNGWDIDTKDNAGWTIDGTEENIWVVDGIASNGWRE